MAMVVHLGMFVDYLESRGTGAPGARGLSDPLHRLAMALEALDEGDVHPMLSPDEGKRRLARDGGQEPTQGRRPKLPLYELMARARVAAAMQLAMECGMKRKAAAAAIAKAIAGSNLLAGVRGRPAEAVERWRDQILELSEKRTLDEMPPNEPSDRRAAGAFNYEVALSRTLVSALGLAPAEALDRIVRHLRESNGPAGKGGDSGLARAKSGRPPP